jgi:hypothetical protein
MPSNAWRLTFPAEVLPPARKSLTSRLRGFLNAPIRDDVLLECQLLLLSFSIGIQDAASFPDC